MNSSSPQTHVEQWYRARAEQLAHRAELQALLRLARERIGDALRIDNQYADLALGAAIGIPVWQRTTWASKGAVCALLCDQPLLEVEHPDGTRSHPSSGEPVELGEDHSIRLEACSTPCRAELVLVRAAGAELPPPRRRMSARVFTPRREPIAAAFDWSNQRTLQFHSRPRVRAQLAPASVDEVANEPVFEACGIEQALAAGGPLVRRFVEALPDDWRAAGADVRVGVTRDELSPGWNPCAVAFHIDGTSRIRKRADGHADLVAPGRTVEQMIACFGPASPTRFLVGEPHLPEPPLGDLAPAAGARWSELLEEQRRTGRLVEWRAPPNALVEYGFGVFHTGSVSDAVGWRCFVKAMRFRGDPLPDAARPREHGVVSWPIEGPRYPTEPCGVFPDDAP